MANQAESNSREKTLGENVIIFALIAILMSSFLYYFFKQEQRLTEVGFDAVARKFSSSVLAIRAQWFMDGQPDEIIIKEKNKPNVTIKVNHKGWIDFNDEKERCQKIWQALMTTDLYFMNQPIAVIEINNVENGSNYTEIKVLNICRYSLSTGESFDYYLSNGKVSEIILR
jgi:hypothetical protein